MRQLWAGGLGIGLAVGGSALGQGPAARLGVVQAMPASNEPVARGQIPTGPPATPPAAPAAPSQGGILGPPKLFTGGPGVFEQRQPPAPQPGVQPTAGYPVPSYQPPVAAGPAVPCPTPAGAVVGGGPLFPSPQLDDPLFGCPPVGGEYVASSAANKWWVSGEYLWWWTRSATTPALLTTSNALDQGVIRPGNSTRVLLGNTAFGNTGHSGGRFGMGYWFGTEQRWGFEAGAFFLGRNGVTSTFDSAQYPVLARPFTELNRNMPSAEYIATPLVGLVGSAAVQYENSLWGLDLNLRRFVTKTSCARLDFIGGFRFLSLEEQLTINETARQTNVLSPQGDFTQAILAAYAAGIPLTGSVNDTFRTTNRFYGGQLGLNGEVRRGRWFANLTGKAAFGTVFQSVNVSGSQTFTVRDATTGVVSSGTAAGGLLALPGANIGNYTRNKFAVAPEVGLNLGYHITPHCRLYVGYTFLYLSNVLRPGDQIDSGLDFNRVPNFSRPTVPTAPPLPTVAQTRPTIPFRDSDFFAQGVNLGLQFTW